MTTGDDEVGRRTDALADEGGTAPPARHQRDGMGEGAGAGPEPAWLGSAVVVPAQPPNPDAGEEPRQDLGSPSAPATDDLAVADLRTYRDARGRELDPVDPRAAAMLLPYEAREAGLLPFALGPNSIYVAAVVPLPQTAQAILRRLSLMAPEAGGAAADPRRGSGHDAVEARSAAPGRRLQPGGQTQPSATGVTADAPVPPGATRGGGSRPRRLVRLGAAARPDGARTVVEHADGGRRHPLRERTVDAATSIRLFRSDPAGLAAAQDRVYGPRDAGASYTAFGTLAVNMGKIAPEALRAALGTQMAQGGRLGAILTTADELNFRDVAEVLAQQAELPFIDLLGEAPGRPGTTLAAAIDPGLFDLMPEAFWRTHAAVPLRRLADVLVVAVEDAHDHAVALEIGNAHDVRVRRVVTGRRDIGAALEARYQRTYLEGSREELARLRPQDSARQLLSRPQQVATALFAVLVGVGLWRFFTPTLTVLNALAELAFAALVGFRLWLMRRPTETMLEITVSQDDLAALQDVDLPVYTILVPVRDEAEVLPVLAQALREIDYPKDRLDVKLLVEGDDRATLQAALANRLPSYIEIVTLPVGQPRTKPKACNYGLYHARGEYVVIYDAEDIPEPDQLKKALVAFAKSGPEVACVQAKLSYFNREQNMLTRWFTAEYAMWFDVMLPALQDYRFPIPLGGTSNHMRVDVLRRLGAWDPYNVTEDADLGVRLHKAGYLTAMVDSTTYEEANSDFVNWVRQRSRWVKGYIQTWLVHMRHPLRLLRELRPAGFFGFQMIVAGTPLILILNPIYWLLTTLWFMAGWNLVPLLFPTWVYYLGMINLLFGGFAFTYLNMAAIARRGHWELVKYTLLVPLYWGIMSLAAWKSLLQVATRPSHWEKTMHGLADVSGLTGPEAGRPGWNLPGA